MSNECPCCGEQLRWEKVGNREHGYCKCNPYGPVIERDVLENPWHELLAIPGVNREIAKALCAIGLCSIAEIEKATDETLLSVPGIGPIRAAKIRGLITNGK